jgi:hypothetical protein
MFMGGYCYVANFASKQLLQSKTCLSNIAWKEMLQYQVKQVTNCSTASKAMDQLLHSKICDEGKP